MKLARWAADNMRALRDADPVMPSGFVNRLAENWRLLFAIADLANCGKRVRAAALRLSPCKRRSDGVRLLEVLYKMFADREVLTSAEIVSALIADEEGEWVEYQGRSLITKRQVALLLAPYDIRPVVVHPGRRSTASPRGYKRAQFDDVFARFLGRQPHIRTLRAQKAAKKGQQCADVRMMCTKPT